MLRMVCVIRACVVFMDPDRAVAHTAHGAPMEVAKVDDEVWSYIVDRFVNVQGVLNECVKLRPDFVAQRFELHDQFRSKGLVILGYDSALRFAPVNINE